MKQVLITGGAGFIGSHTADALIARGYAVRVLDSMLAQVHGGKARPDYLHPDVELQIGDVRDPKAVARALNGVDIVYHFAAETGVGQSMLEVARHFDTNVQGTAVVWQEIQRAPGNIQRVVLSSSRAVYGEGAYRCSVCGMVYPGARSQANLEQREWGHNCPSCGGKASPAATSEGAPLNPGSVYALTKRFQEESFALIGRAAGIDTVTLRYFNVYGPRQSLSNAYTGILAGFATRIRSGKNILLYEDGLPARDFVHVKDVVAANLKAIDASTLPHSTFNVGSGQATTLVELADSLARAMNADVSVERTSLFRLGDIFACYADTERAAASLGFVASIGLEDGLRDFVKWANTQAAFDHTDEVEKEMRAAGILRGA